MAKKKNVLETSPLIKYLTGVKSDANPGLPNCVSNNQVLVLRVQL